MALWNHVVRPALRFMKNAFWAIYDFLVIDVLERTVLRMRRHGRYHVLHGAGSHKEPDYDLP